jgi:hypothetical protein
MRTPFRPLLAAALLTTTPAAWSFDVAPYLALTPGNWGVLQDSASGQLSGYVTTVNAAGQVAQTWYRYDGSTWVFDSAELFSLTARRISYLGFDDGNATWLFEPALSFPRKQNVGDAVVYKGAVRNQTTNEVVNTVGAITFTAEALSVSVPAGGFANCIKVRNYSYQAGQSRDSVSISCPNRNEVRTWYTKIRDTADAQVEDLSERHGLVMIQGGDSNPPFP